MPIRNIDTLSLSDLHKGIDALRKSGSEEMRESERTFDAAAYREPRGETFVSGEGGNYLALRLLAANDGSEEVPMIDHLVCDAAHPEIVEQLLAKAIMYLKDRDIHHVSIRVSPEQEAVIKLLHHLGFHEKTREDGMITLHHGE